MLNARFADEGISNFSEVRIGEHLSCMVTLHLTASNLLFLLCGTYVLNRTVRTVAPVLDDVATEYSIE